MNFDLPLFFDIMTLKRSIRVKENLSNAPFDLGLLNGFEGEPRCYY